MPAVAVRERVHQQEGAAAAFSKQAASYDRDDEANPILAEMRAQVYRHVHRYLKPNSQLLELNAGTGIDALHFVKRGHKVHCVELADGMVQEIQKKIADNALADYLTVDQRSFTDLDSLQVPPVDYVFSNMGGLNCTADLREVFQPLMRHLNPGATITLVIMTPLSPWDWLAILKLRWKHATRRFERGPVKAHLMDEHFNVFYHSIASVKKALGRRFELLDTESLGLFLPPPDKIYIPQKFPRIYSGLKKMDRVFRGLFPFSRMGDHVIMTFRYVP